jgi:hypothetical protein
MTPHQFSASVACLKHRVSEAGDYPWRGRRTLCFLKHGIADKRILRLVAKWLRAGVIEAGREYQPMQVSSALLRR